MMLCVSPVFEMNNIRGKTDAGIYDKNGYGDCCEQLFHRNSLYGFKSPKSEVQGFRVQKLTVS